MPDPNASHAKDGKFVSPNVEISSAAIIAALQKQVGRLRTRLNSRELDNSLIYDQGVLAGRMAAHSEIVNSLAKALNSSLHDGTHNFQRNKVLAALLSQVQVKIDLERDVAGLGSSDDARDDTREDDDNE